MSSHSASPMVLCAHPCHLPPLITAQHRAQTWTVHHEKQSKSSVMAKTQYPNRQKSTWCVQGQMHTFPALWKGTSTTAYTNQTPYLTNIFLLFATYSTCLINKAAYTHAKSLQSCPTLCDPMDCSLPGSSVHGILQARILEWVAMPSSRGSSQPRD